MSAQPAKSPNRVTDRRQRRYPRFRSEFPVSVSLFSGKEHEKLSAHCRDLSQGGIGVLIPAELNVGEVASLVFSLPTLPQPSDLRAGPACPPGYHYGFLLLPPSP